jgi:hypothetical protein
MPPVGSIVVGPCPQCEQFVAIFCGKALPLDRDVILKGAHDERCQHLRDVLTHFLDERIGHLAEQIAAYPEGMATPAELDDWNNDLDELFGDDDADGNLLCSDDDSDNGPRENISDVEVERFLDQELPRIDNSGYFRAVFD